MITNLENQERTNISYPIKVDISVYR